MKLLNKSYASLRKCRKCTHSSMQCPSIYPNDPTIPYSHQSSYSCGSGELFSTLKSQSSRGNTISALSQDICDAIRRSFTHVLVTCYSLPFLVFTQFYANIGECFVLRCSFYVTIEEMKRKAPKMFHAVNLSTE